MARKKIKRKQQKIQVPKTCNFCVDKKEPLFTDISVLRRFVTERGKILPRARTGLCGKHQRRLASSVKHARHLALMPFMIKV
ncbi:30S ribosomal protein S18 [Patescibacteria group bacterium]|nr:30S ribosomal protein S18 [Patescibacteria group bacterium]